LSRMSQLLYAPDGGASICAGGFNPFGLANSTVLSPACRTFLQTQTHDVTRLEQEIAEGNLTGSIVELPAGNLKFSATVGYRCNSYAFNPDPARESNDVIGTLSTSPTQGKERVKEEAIEFLVPVLKDVPFAYSLDLDLGLRSSDYDITGRQQTYKIDAMWKP